MAAAYLRDPAAIYAESFATIRREADLSRFEKDEQEVAVRLIHACGMVDIAGDLVFSPGAVQAGRQALGRGAPVLCDARMVAEGVMRRLLPAGNEVLCGLDLPDAAAHGAALGTTRSAGAIEALGERLAGAILAVGNAPTALFHLLERVDRGLPRPALILGFPVGFVGAAESKAALVADGRVPFIALSGRRGGSAMAAAAVNALAGGLGA